MKLFRDTNEIDEFFQQKRLDSLKFNMRKMVLFAIFAYLITVAIILTHKEKFPPGEAEKSILVGGVVIAVFLVFVSWYSRFMQKVLGKIWQWHKSQ